MIGCGRNEGREPPRIFDGEVRGDGGDVGAREENLASLASPSKRFSAVARGMEEGDGGEARVREARHTTGKGKGVWSSSSASVTGS